MSKRLRLCGLHGEGYGSDRVGVVAKFDVEYFSFGRRNRQEVLRKTLWNGDRVGEICIAAHRVEQEELVAAECALLFGRGLATNLMPSPSRL